MREKSKQDKEAQILDEEFRNRFQRTANEGKERKAKSAEEETAGSLQGNVNCSQGSAPITYYDPSCYEHWGWLGSEWSSQPWMENGGGAASSGNNRRGRAPKKCEDSTNPQPNNFWSDNQLIPLRAPSRTGRTGRTLRKRGRTGRRTKFPLQAPSRTGIQTRTGRGLTTVGQRTMLMHLQAPSLAGLGMQTRSGRPLISRILPRGLTQPGQKTTLMHLLAPSLARPGKETKGGREMLGATSAAWSRYPGDLAGFSDMIPK